MSELKDYSEDKSIFGFMYKGLKESLDNKKTKREASFELLRMISMMMVIVLHYVSKGGLLNLQEVAMPGKDMGFWFLEAACLVAVNVFILISGYFMVNSEYSLYKVIGIWCQVFFYSVVGAVIAVIAGIYSIDDLLCLKNILFFAFPGVNGHYWFATSYILMYLFSPLLVKGMKALDRDKLRLVIVIILIPLCFIPSMSPIGLVTDDKGNSFVWFMCLFLIAGYIRLYGIRFLENKAGAIFAYVASVIAIVLTRACFSIVTMQTSGYEYLVTIVTQYNFIFVLTASLGFFYIFKNVSFKEGMLSSLILKISPYVLGVYLLHEHLTVRYLWPEWFKVSDTYGPLRIVHILLTVIIIFMAGIIVDIIRCGIFFVCKKIMIWGLNIYFAKQEMWDYLLFGFLATVVNWVAYFVFSYCLLVPFITGNDTLLKTVGNVIAWVVAVLFAYWTNRNFVFKSKITGFNAILKEFSSFIGARIFSFVVEQVLFWLSLVMNISDIIAKIIIGVVVIILNYIFSKLFVFKKKADK